MSNQAIAGFRLSIQQERIWSQQSRAEVTFWAECELVIEGPLDAEKLREAIRRVVQRHEILRTVFHRQAGVRVPFQVIQESPDFVCRVADLSELDENSQRAKIENLVGRQRSEFNPENGPDLHVVLARVASLKYVMVLSLPALCADLGTMQNLVSEIVRAYTQEFDAADEVMQYADVAEWQQELLASDESKPARDYWRDYCRKIDVSALESLLASFEKKLPVERPPDLVLREIDLRALAAVANSSLREFLLVSWQLFLFRMTGRTRITTGGMFDGRNHEELVSALGAFAKYLPLELECSDSISFETLLQQAKRDIADFRNWQDSFSWSHAVMPADPEQAFPVTFDYFELHEVETVGDLRVSIARLAAHGEQATLGLSAHRRGDLLSLAFRFDPGRLDRAMIERWSGHFITLLTAAATSPATLACKLPLLDENDRRLLLVDWNQTSAPYPNSNCIHDLFEAQAVKSPDAPALRYQDDCLTYRQLNEQANRLAHYLRGNGVESDSLVGLCVDRGTSMMVAVLAVMKAGGVYVPLSADHPKPRLAQQLANATVLITEAKFECLMPSFAGPVVLMDRDSEQWSQEPPTNPEPVTNPESLAYVIYTSGSTGTPKGVAIRHRNLVNYTSFIQRRLELDNCAAPLHFATVSTLGADLGNTCIYPSLVSGGCLHVIGFDVAADSQRLREYTAKYPIDVLKIVPSHLTALLNSGGGKDILPRKYLITGGETLTIPLMEKIIAAGGACEVLNHYGPTETTIGSLTLCLKDYDWTNTSAQTIPIGRPIANTRIYILDPRGAPVPIGVAGELYIGGDGVSVGYVNQPDRTAERFVPEHFVPDPEARMYRTGDLVRYLPDGNVEFLGRVDDQVKIRGFRIELGEVESTLLRHGNVSQAVVLAPVDERGERSIVAYVVGTAGADELRNYLRGQLPDYMVPSAIVELPKLPLNANGKVDRQALPRPDDVQGAKKEPVNPRTPSEEVVAAIWEEVLKRDGIGVEDNFFEIGGHSLLATQIASRLREHFRTPVPVRAVFEAPTIAETAKRMDFARREEQGVLPPAILPVPRNEPLPLSYAQERLWVLDQLEPNTPLYNIPRTLRLRGTLNTGALEKALNEIVRRHESQRTTFTTKDGHPVQVVAPTLTIPLVIRDLTGLPQDERENEARRIAAKEGMRPFDLAKGPLVRADLVRISHEDHVLQLTMHHAISDAWSAGIFLQELAAIYEAFSAGKPSPLPELKVQYADYAAQERGWLQGEVLDKQLAFWRERLKGIPPLIDLPLDRPRPSNRTFEGAYDVLHISAEELAEIKRLGRQEGATPFMTLMTVFQALLSRYSGEEQIVVGTDLANRTMPETERMIGFFINLLPVRTDLSGNPTFRELLRRVREGLLESYAHQEVPFPKIVQEIQPERSSAHNPIVQVLFVMQNIPRPRRELAGLQVEAFDLQIIQSKFDMAVFIAETPDGLVGYWVYSTELFERLTIQRMIRHYCNLLRSALSQPDARLSALAMFSQEEIEQQGAEKQSRKRSQFGKLSATVPQAVGFSGNNDVEH